MVVSILVLVAAGGLIARHYLAARAAGGEAAAWATGVAAMGPIRVTVSGSGALQPGSVAEVKTLVSGTVHRVLVGNGEAVTAGTPLVELENEKLMLEWEQARLTYEEECETLGEMTSGTTSSSTARRAAELRVEQALMDLNAKREQVDALAVRAAADGKVTAVSVAAGDEVKAGAQLLTLLEGPRAEAVLPVSETIIHRIAAGDRAAVILGPLPDVHTVTIHIYEPSVYNLRVGDQVKATIDGKWAGFTNTTVPGEVVAISGGATFFAVTCRLPGVPSSVPAGATVSYLQLFPTGQKGDETVLTASGKLDLETDVWGLDQKQLKGNGLAGAVREVAQKGVRPAQGEVTYDVTIALDQCPEAAREGMSVHACIWPEAGGPVSGVTSLVLPAQDVGTASGGAVSFVAVKPGDLVKKGDLLLQITNEGLAHQLEQAYYDLAVAEENLAKAKSAGDTDRKVRLQEIKTRQAELTLEALLDDVESLTVTAPQDGVVTGLNENLATGRAAQAGAAVCRVLNYDAMELTLSIDELEVALLRPGLPATVAVDAIPGKAFPAEVVEVAQEGTYSSGVSKFDVTLSVEASPQLRAQMTATATIHIAAKESALLVPAEAVSFLGDGAGEVSVVGADGKVKQARIEVGLYNDSQVEVVSGLRAGDVVITGTPDGGDATGGFMPGQGGTIIMPGGDIRGGGSTIIRPSPGGGQPGPR